MAESQPLPPLGALVRARVEGWREAQIENASPFPDPAVPSLEGVPEFVEGELGGFQVEESESVHAYFK